jgi:hypothetical protein
MIFVITFSSKPYWSFKNNIKLIINTYISKTNFILKFWFILKLMCFILIKSCIIFQINFFKIKKASDNPKNIKWYRGMIKSVTQHSYFEKTPDK